MVDYNPERIARPPLGGVSEGRSGESMKLISRESDLSFRPRYSPERIRVRKERNLDRSESFCEGEDVSDTGSKNREIHISGRIRDSATNVFDAVLDEGSRFTLICAAGTYRVYVDEGEYDGVQGRDGKTGENLWQYSLDLVADPISEQRDGPGIIDDGGRDLDDRDIDFGVLDPFIEG